MNALSASDILSKEEVRAVLDYCRAHRVNRNIRQNEIIFRLSVGCGLRVTEICRLSIGDMFLASRKPTIRLKKRNVKGKTRMRTVPLWWDDGNISVLSDWVQHRKDNGATSSSPVVIPICRESRQLYRQEVARRWKSVVRKALGNGRASQLHIHCGRHTFASHALEVGHSLVEVQMALGHSSIGMTSRYLHLVERDNVPNLYS